MTTQFYQSQSTMEPVLIRNLSISQKTAPSIVDQMTHLQIDIEGALRRILEQAGEKINLERQAEIQQKMIGTKQVIDRFKNQYA